MECHGLRISANPPLPSRNLSSIVDPKTIVVCSDQTMLQPLRKERTLMTNGDDVQAPVQPPTLSPEIRPMEQGERIIRAYGVDLCVQTFGDRVDPPILLIMGG